MKRLISSLMCSTMLLTSACTGVGSYIASDKAAPYAAMAKDDLMIPISAPKLLSIADINRRFPANSCDRFAAMAISTSPSVMSDLYALSTTSIGVAQTRSLLYPSVNLDAAGGGTDNSGYSEVRTAAHVGIGLTFALFDGGAGALKVDAARERTLGAAAKLEETAMAVGAGAYESCTNVARQRKLVNVYDKHIASLRIMRVGLKGRQAQGDPNVSVTDIAELDAKIEADIQRRIQAVQLRDDEEARFVRVVGIRAPAEIKVTYPAEHDRGAAHYDKHPSIQLCEREIQAAVRTMMSIDAERHGSLTLRLGTLGLALGMAVASPWTFGSALAQLTVPLLDGGEHDARLEQAIGQIKVAVARAADIRRTVVMAVAQTDDAEIAAGATVKSTVTEIGFLSTAYQGRQIEYTTTSRGTVQSVLDTEQSLALAETRLISADAELGFSRLRRLAAKGELLSRYKLVDYVEVVVGKDDAFVPPSRLAEKPAS